MSKSMKWSKKKINDELKKIDNISSFKINDDTVILEFSDEAEAVSCMQAHCGKMFGSKRKNRENLG